MGLKIDLVALYQGMKLMTKVWIMFSINESIATNNTHSESSANCIHLKVFKPGQHYEYSSILYDLLKSFLKRGLIEEKEAYRIYLSRILIARSASKHVALVHPSVKTTDSKKKITLARQTTLSNLQTTFYICPALVHWLNWREGNKSNK